jgi:hypothetical protein
MISRETMVRVLFKSQGAKQRKLREKQQTTKQNQKKTLKK